MMPTKTIEWYEQGDVPLGHIEIVETSLTWRELQGLISDLEQTKNEMIWFGATWLSASAGFSGNKSHLLRKADYELDKQHKALCGKVPNGAWHEHWNVAAVIDGPGSAYSVCQICLKLYEKANSPKE